MNVIYGDEESERRYATQRLGISLNRGLKPTATVIGSLCDTRCEEAGAF